MAVSLYKLTNDLLELQSMLEECDEEDAMSEEVIKDTIEALEGDIEEKMQGCAIVVKNLKNDYEMIDKEVKRLQNKANSLKNSIKKLQNSMQATMVVLDQRKIKTNLFNIYIQKNPPSVAIDKELKDIPKKYLIEQEPKIDKTKILKELKQENNNIDFAHIEQSESLRIK